MKTCGLLLTLAAGLIVVSCDVQSGITKKSVEKYEPTPTPAKTVEVVEQIDPADIVNSEITESGPNLSVNPSDVKKSVDCTKYNRVTVNGDGKEISVKGICKQLMVNGDRNTITGVAFAEIVLNGGENSVEYSKYVNAKKPVVKDNGAANTISKID